MYRNQSFKNYRAESQHQRFRLNLLIAILIILSLILILRLAFLQISEFKRYQTLSLKKSNERNTYCSSKRGYFG